MKILDFVASTNSSVPSPKDGMAIAIDASLNASYGHLINTNKQF